LAAKPPLTMVALARPPTEMNAAPPLLTVVLTT
jgi:hypothetical protein